MPLLVAMLEPDLPSSPKCDDPLQSQPVNYIVGFHKYFPTSELPRTVASILTGGGWKYVPRSNPAQAFPSDFAVVQIAAGVARGALVDTLRKSTFVKYVMIDRKITNALKQMDPANDGESEGQGEGSEKDVRFNKWKAKPFPFMGLYGRRRLLGSHPAERHGDNVARAFQASKLWEKGFTGKGVRVAVFDTGVMKGHPHFRDVRIPCIIVGAVALLSQSPIHIV
jgi:membrane-bound transcription factor site-1 protease